jgi:heptosyltransferase-2
MPAKQFLIIQTAFLGDAVLATSILEKLHAFYPDAAIDLVVRKGNEGLFLEHPFLRKVLVWEKRRNKTRNLFQLIRELRSTDYDHIINCQRFFSTGLMTVFAKGQEKIGFSKNPLSFLFSRRVKHSIPEPKALRGQLVNSSAPIVHEVDRLNALIEHLTDAARPLPRLYPTLGSRNDAERVRYQHTEDEGRYVCIAPASVWFTKQWPEAKWVELIKSLPAEMHVFLIGAPSDGQLCERISNAAGRGFNVSEDLGPLGSAVLMESAAMNYVNDSAPLHIASAMNAPVTAVFCSTVPAFGFGPLNANGRILERKEPLSCRPCGLHGYKACPEGHFKCALEVDLKEVLPTGLPTQTKVQSEQSMGAHSNKSPTVQRSLNSGIPQREHDIEAIITAIASKDGGRKSPLFSGYRPDHNFFTHPELNGGMHVYATGSIAPGETGNATIWLLAPERNFGLMQEGAAFTVQEGNRVVATGKITKLVNDRLRKANA